MSDQERDDLNEALGSTETVASPQSKTKKPSLYKVVILNDDFTPRDFVVLVLMRFFGKNETDATRLMLTVHNEGAGIAGVFSYEIAETKTYQVNTFAKQQKFPLKCVMEEAEL